MTLLAKWWTQVKDKNRNIQMYITRTVKNPAAQQQQVHCLASKISHVHKRLPNVSQSSVGVNDIPDVLVLHICVDTQMLLIMNVESYNSNRNCPSQPNLWVVHCPLCDYGAAGRKHVVIFFTLSEGDKGVQSEKRRREKRERRDEMNRGREKQCVCLLCWLLQWKNIWETPTWIIGCT